MDIPVTQLPPGDPRLVEAIVGQLKSKGIFDQFRKECLADVDTKPAFQNLRQRVEGHVNKFLEKNTWKNDMNKNQLRDGVRKHVNGLGILESGIDAIITQVVNPKIKPLILPYVEDTVYAFLQIDKPKREKQECIKETAVVEPIPFQVPQPAEIKPTLLPMETDVISSEEDDILARESPEAEQKSPPTPEASVVKDESEDARDGFEDYTPYKAETAEEIVTSQVERLHLNQDTEDKPSTTLKPTLPLFDDQSLDSISSNSSGLTFSTLSGKGSPETKKSPDNQDKSEGTPVLMQESRSTTSTPLVDEKPRDEDVSQSSLESTYTKDYPPSEPKYGEPLPQYIDPSVTTESSIGADKDDQTVASGSIAAQGEESQESKGSVSKVSTASEKSDAEDKAKYEKSEGEITTSSPETSDSENKGRQTEHHRSEEKHTSDSSHKSRKSKSDHKSKRDSHSREREKDRDGKHHRDKERKHSKSRDDHHSHRDKDKKHHRRDKDHDGDRDRPRSHHSSSRDVSSSGSGSSSGKSSGERDKERSSHHSSDKSNEGKSRKDKSSSKGGNKADESSEGKADGTPSDPPENKSSKSDSQSDRSDVKSSGKSESKSDKSDSKSSSKSESKSDKHESKSSSKSDRSDKKHDSHSSKHSSSSKHRKEGEKSSSDKHRHSSKDDKKKRDEKDDKKEKGSESKHKGEKDSKSDKEGKGGKISRDEKDRKRSREHKDRSSKEDRSSKMNKEVKSSTDEEKASEKEGSSGSDTDHQDNRMAKDKTQKRRKSSDGKGTLDSAARNLNSLGIKEDSFVLFNDDGSAIVLNYDDSSSSPQSDGDAEPKSGTTKTDSKEINKKMEVDTKTIKIKKPGNNETLKSVNETRKASAGETKKIDSKKPILKRRNITEADKTNTSESKKPVIKRTNVTDTKRTEITSKSTDDSDSLDSDDSEAKKPRLKKTNSSENKKPYVKKTDNSETKKADINTNEVRNMVTGTRETRKPILKRTDFTEAKGKDPQKARRPIIKRTSISESTDQDKTDAAENSKAGIIKAKRTTRNQDTDIKKTDKSETRRQNHKENKDPETREFRKRKQIETCKNNNIDKEKEHDFEGFDSWALDTRLTDYLRTTKTVPDEMDMELDEWFDDSDLHMEVSEDDFDKNIDFGEFLSCMRKLGAVVKRLGKGREGIRSEAEGEGVRSEPPPVKRRRASTSSSASSSTSQSGSPQHRRSARSGRWGGSNIQGVVQSETTQLVERQNTVTPAGYLLTPEDDGNRTSSRDYEVDYSQRINTYSPLSPASDSSADDGKPKTGDTSSAVHNVAPGAQIEDSTKVFKSATTWSSEGRNISV